jgi:hypothetical protein
MGQMDFLHAYTIRVLSGLTLLLISGMSHAALVTLTFEGDLDAVTAGSTVGYGAANPAYLSGATAYSGVVEYDSDSGAIIYGELTFASGYAVNNYHDFIPTLAWIERSWDSVTYALSGAMVSDGDMVSLLIGNLLDPAVNLVGDAEVLAMASASLAPAISGAIPTCTAFEADRQSTNCNYAPGEEILGLDSLSLQLSTLTNTHVLAMDEVIEHCGGDCSTEWWHMSGGGVASIATVPVPPALWLFGSGLLVIFRKKLRFDPSNK